MKEVRTRFAPSPTGFQHVGGFRTAFYAYLLAKHFGGKFLLRIEDTDRERFVPGAIRFIIEELAWFGISFDEGPSLSELEKAGEPVVGLQDIGGPYGPYIQSLRLPRYREIADELIAKGHAYRCDCTPEMLEKERLEQLARKELPGYSGFCRGREVPASATHCVRFKMAPKRALQLNDAVKKIVTWDAVPMKDPVLMKSDGYPTYHLASVVDDHDMLITHVMRGDEWLSSAPLHLMLYEALGWEAPLFAHLPVILGSDGKKLSKRTGAASSKSLREEGYLAEAVLNYVVLIGWAPGEGSDQEVFSREELIAKFTLERVNNASGVFDANKLAWMNGLYIRKLPVQEFSARARPLLENSQFGAEFRKYPERWNAMAPHVQERTKLLPEVVAMVDFLFLREIPRAVDEMFQKGIDRPKAIEILSRTIQIVSALPTFLHKDIEAALRPLAEEFSLKVGPIFGVIRIAVTGKKVTPPLFESIEVLGKEITLARLNETLSMLRGQG